MEQQQYRVLPGPEGFLPPAAASMGVELPERGEALVEGVRVPADRGMKEVATRLLGAKNPTFFPGPLILWDWKPGVAQKAEALVELADAVGARIIPMPDYRPKYPMIDPAVEINPNHPNLTIAHNDIDVCVFIGVHCHYANIALKIIRGGTACCTIALCGDYGHEDAVVSLRDVGLTEVKALTDTVRNMKAGG